MQACSCTQGVAYLRWQVPQRDPAQEEVFIELFSFLGSRRTHLVVTAFGAAAAFDEGVMGLDDLFHGRLGV
jgi:hypothetical protein